jgi:hypothetical protein
MNTKALVKHALRDRGVDSIDSEKLVIEIIQYCEAGDLSAARQTIPIDNQAVSDRIVQEIVMESGEVTNEAVHKQMPLIRDETDLGKVGDIHYFIPDIGDGMVRLEKKQFDFAGFDDDGTSKIGWATLDSIELPENHLGRIVRLAEDYGEDQFIL